MKAMFLAAVLFWLWPDFVLSDHLREANRQRYLARRQPMLGDSSYMINASLLIQLPDLTIHLSRGRNSFSYRVERG